MNTARAWINRAYSALITSAIWVAGGQLNWPDPLVAVGEVFAAAGLAAAVYALTAWTRGSGGGAVQVALQAVAWTAVAAVAGVWMVASVPAGVAAGALLFYAAGFTWREQVERAWRWLRREPMAGSFGR